MSWLDRVRGKRQESGDQPGWLIVGLGNPGPEYENTPHNLGFLAVDRLAGDLGSPFRSQYCQAIVGSGRLEAERILLAKPLTYMNLSGSAVKCLLDKHGLGTDRLLVVYDEADLPWGSIRIRPGGSAGGHKGVASIIRSVGTEDFARIRLGVHPGHDVRDLASYVLAPIRGERLRDLELWLGTVTEAIRSAITEGVEKAMTKFNRRALG